MTYADRIERAGLEVVVQQVRDQVGSWEPERRSRINAARPGLFDRVDNLLEHVETLIATVSGDYVSDQRIQELNNRLVGLSNSTSSVDVNNYQLDQFVGQVEMLAAELAQWPPAPTDDWRQAVTAAATSYRRRLGRQLGSFQSELDQLKQQLSGYGGRVEEANQALNERSEKHARQLALDTRAMAERLAGLELAIKRSDDRAETVSARVDKQVSRYDKEFAEGQTARTQDFESASKEVEQKSADLLQKIQDRLDEAESMGAFLAGGVTGSAFSQEATKQKRTADSLRLGALGFGLMAGLAALWLARDATGDVTISWQTVTARLSLSFLLAGLASYLATQSQRHRRREEEARRTEMQLIAFDPFVRGLDEEERARARTKLAATIFSDAQVRDEPQTPALTDQHIGLVQKLLEVLVKR